MSSGQKTSSGQNKIPTERTVPNTLTKPEGMVSHYPLSAVFVVFGIGLGVGVALGCLLGGTVTPRPSFGQRAELAAENLGRQMRGAIAGVLPASLSKHIST
jgi:hypothetical protein